MPSDRGVFLGLDFKQMINDALKKKEGPIKKAEETLSFNNEKVAALSQLQSFFNDFSTSLTKIKGLSLGETGEDLLQAKKVVMSASNGENADTFLRVTPGYNFDTENFTLEVTQLARNRILQSAGFTSITSSATNAVSDHTNVNLFTPGTFTINGQNVVVAAGDNLQNVVNKINSQTGVSNVSAKIINPAANDYRMMLESSIIGSGSVITLGDPDNVLNSVLSAPNSVVQTEQNAIFKYNDNVLVEKSTNTITDFIEGLTIDLYNATISGSPAQSFKIKVAVVEDIDKAIAGIEDFVDSYNNVLKFITQQQGRDEDGNYYSTAKIQRDEYITNLLSDVRAVAAELAFVQDSSFKFGIRYIDETPANPQTNEPPYKGLLSLDSNMMRSAMQADFATVAQHFRFQMTGDVAQLNLYQRGEGIRSGNITLNIDINRTNYDIVRVTYNASTVNMTFQPYDAFDFTKGGRIIGQSGTLMEGYEFGYTGAGVEVKNLSITQGVADKIFERMREVSSTTATTGRTIIESEIVGLLSENANQKLQISTQIERMEKERNTLLARYSKMEAKAAQYQSMMDFLEAQSNAMTKK
jgi:flagellar hook-associated protein 2